MTEEKTIVATDLEDFDEVDVIEVLVSVGDTIGQGQSIVTLESEKAMMEFPSPYAGIIKSISVSVGDKIKEGEAILVVQVPSSSVSDAPRKQEQKKTVNSAGETRSEKQSNGSNSESENVNDENAQLKGEQKEATIFATDLEDFDEVDVIEVLVAVGETVDKNQSLITLESDKATMEFPSPQAGKITQLAVNVGDKIKDGQPILTLLVTDSVDTVKPSTVISNVENESQEIKENPAISDSQPSSSVKSFRADSAYASPSVRKYANELGVNLELVSGSANQGRVLKEDVQSYVQSHVEGRGARVSRKGSEKLPDFSEFGPIEETKLNKLKQVSAKHLSHAWQVAPHVTQFDEADITELEKTRKQLKEDLAPLGIKLTILPFIMKALANCLREFPDFNSSVSENADSLIYKKYFHIGIAVDTPRGLVVPIVRDVDKKIIKSIAEELMDVSKRARESKLTPKDMQGGCMTISSIGGIGGQHFTPIINYPEVAILGVSQARLQLVKIKDEIQERLILPLSLSYDHRAVDGVAAVKFITSLKNKLNDVWSLML